MEPMNLLTTRRTVRQYDQAFKIPKADLEKIAKASIVSPTANNIQGLDLIVLVNHQKMDEITSAALSAWSEGLKNNFSGRIQSLGVKDPITCDATSLFLIVKNSRAADGNFTYVDAGEMCMSIIVAARSLGYETMNVGCLAIDGGKAVERVLNLPAGSFVTAIAVGKAKPTISMGKKEVLSHYQIVE